ncbi:secretory carrier-associated membrane protein [Elysia marginata]|uniref:Secretory carrier-associated membrane protein n=1 Tax=Elysia marginata TaxID=1093978 RepID=A0AAV4JCR3_9GAST|nr:secretory carrier-associated membrane protein [Elysia marginata]
MGPFPRRSEKRFKDTNKASMMDLNIDPTLWEALFENRPAWGVTVTKGAKTCEQQCLQVAKTKRAARKARANCNLTPQAADVPWTCPHCNRDFSALTRDDRPPSQSCHRPDVLLCVSDTENNLNNAFPNHLQCFDHYFTYSLLQRFGVLGTNSMETISKQEQNRLLRLSSKGLYSDSLDNNSQVWTSKADVLKLEVAQSINVTFFDFQNDHLGKIRCTGTGYDTGTKCAMFECPNRHLLDNQSQTCYRPERVIFQVFGTKTKTPKTGGEIGTVPGESRASNATSYRVSVCLYLKTYSVMKTLGWWQVIMDTTSLLEGRCELKFFDYQTDSNLAVNEKEDELPTEEAVTVRADDCLDILTSASEYSCRRKQCIGFELLLRASSKNMEK